MDDKSASVVLRNTMRRPLTFRVAGTTVRLSPGEQMSVPETWLGSAELQHFCGAGHVAAERSVVPATKVEDQVDDETDDDRESRLDKSRKHKPTRHGT